MKAWVVGGTGGIGYAICEALDDEHPELDIAGSGEEVDVRDPESVQAAHDEYGPFELIVYSAGINQLDWLQDIDPEDMTLIFEVNVVGLINVLQACPEAQRVVVVGSDAAWRPMRTSIMYNASKAALHEAVRCIARERANANFAINVVAPGLVSETKMTQYVFERTLELRPELDLHRYMFNQIPMGRWADPQEIAEVVVKVLMMETPYLNGAIIPVNGAR